MKIQLSTLVIIYHFLERLLSCNC